ncbi:MAG TPA: dihydrolipoyl dehydrogenase [Myxococcales bacterium]|nr:dihydrolipoyl dehydrogenase [Myxococcales bacterium]
MAQYDVAIIGAGPGGYVASIRAGQLGLKTVCIERDPRLGGTCTLRGCIPTKAILHTAELFENAKESAEQGVVVQGVQLDMASVRKHKESVVTKSSKGVEFLFRKNKVDRVHGHARLAGPGRIAVSGGSSGDQIVEAKHVILASGSAPRLLPGLKVDGQRIVTSDELLENTAVPERLIVLGAGAVGVEFASVYERFGSQVTIVELLPHLLPLEDEDISTEFEKSMRRRKVKFLTSAKVETVEVKGDVVRCMVTTQKGTEVLEAEMFLCAVGRRPVTENLDLEKFPKVRVERGFVVVDPHTLLTGEPWLSAIGDAVALPGRPHPQLAHLAFVEGEFVADRLAGHHPKPVDYDRVPGATYSEPEVASVGLTEKAARERGYQVKTGVFPMSANGKARILGAAEGMVKVVAEEKYDEVLGVHIVGPRATEMIAEACSLLRLETTSEEMARVIRPHPTLTEAMTEAAMAVRGKPLHI